ncbi:MAG: hypothetical protein JW912_00455 [Sedimentisphaerales bacterium]|nr:hypothetical protein [Sedimentisphaerales bacterium]
MTRKLYIIMATIVMLSCNGLYAAAAATNADDGAANGHRAGYYTDSLYYNGYSMLYLDILWDRTLPKL